MKLLFRLLYQNISIGQSVAFAVANLLGAFIVLAGWQAYRDVDAVFDDADSFLSSNYIVVSKPVSLITTLSTALGGRPSFSESEIAELERQPGVAGVGSFMAAQFDVSGVIDFQGVQMQTQMFLEAVPDSFIDLHAGVTNKWRANYEDKFVPVIVPQTYLNLYNYGYASSQGLPQISGGLMSKCPLRLVISGNGQQRAYEARIVSFSNRLNTILVPETFLKEANAHLSAQRDDRPSRLIVSTTTSQLTSELMEYISDKGYEIEGNAADSLRMQTLIYGVVYAVIIVGLVMLVLAFFLLFVSIMLLIEKDKERLRTLYSIGYEHRSMALPYILLAVGLDLFTWFGAALFTTFAYPSFSRFLVAVMPDFVPHSLSGVWLAALLLSALFCVLHYVVVRHRVEQTA